MARNFMRDVFDLADEQGWTRRPKEQGYQLMPPRATARPGYESIYIHDPKGDGHAEKVLRDRLRKAGMKFPDEEAHTMSTKVPINSGYVPVPTITVPASPKPGSAFVRARAQYEVVLNELARLEPLIAEAEAEHAEMAKLREAFERVFNK